jgi:hypothetical protein
MLLASVNLVVVVVVLVVLVVTAQVQPLVLLEQVYRHL